MHQAHRIAAALLVSAIVAYADPSPSSGGGEIVAQRDTAIIDLSVSCADCAIEILDSVRLGTTSDVFIPLREPKMLRDAQGLYYLVFHDWVNQPILQYDSAGTLRQRIGTLGRGPGEYTMTRSALIGAGDSLFVFTADRVLQVYSPEGQFVRGARVDGFRPTAATTEDPTQLLALRFGAFKPDVPPLHVFRLDALGQLIDSVPIFSPLNTSVRMGVRVEGEDIFFHPRIESEVAAAPNGAFWTLGRDNYRLELHDSLGRSHKLFAVRTEEEPDPVMTAADIDRAAQQERMVSVLVITSGGRREAQWLDVDSAGLLWVARLVDAPRSDTIKLQTEYRSQYEAPGEGTIPLSVQDRRQHTMIDVIDPQTGVRLATTQLPFRAVRVRAGFIGRLTENDDGFIVPHIYALGLTPTPLQTARFRTPP